MFGGWRSEFDLSFRLPLAFFSSETSSLGLIDYVGMAVIALRDRSFVVSIDAQAFALSEVSL